MVFIILQWNARSLIANGQEFKECISKKENSPDIICIQETWLKPQLNFTLQGYTIIQKDRKQGNGGGVATFIKQGIGFRNIVRDVEQEVVVVEVWEGKQSYKVINFYNPCEKLSLNVLENIGGNKVICMGRLLRICLIGEGQYALMMEVVQEWMLIMGVIQHQI